jgi:hypothetical protein
MKKIAFILFLSFISMFPWSTKAQITPLTEEEVRQFMDEYTARFMKMDLDAYMALFSKEAVENRMLPYVDIREAYKRMIARTHSIEYKLKIYSIQTYTGSALVSGRYEIIQILKGKKRENVLRGDIQWDLVRENGSLKIREVNYGRDH